MVAMALVARSPIRWIAGLGVATISARAFGLAPRFPLVDLMHSDASNCHVPGRWFTDFKQTRRDFWLCYV